MGPLRAELTRELLAAKQSVRLVSRRQTAQSGLLEGNAADLSRLRASARSHQRLRNSLFVRSTPAKPTKRKLVFFDNVYIYGRVDGLMTEETPYNPCSRKGELRAQIATRLMEEGRKSHGNDRTGGHFYGPAALRTYQPPRDRPRCRWKAGMVAQQPKQSFTFTLAGRRQGTCPPGPRRSSVSTGLAPADLLNRARVDRHLRASHRSDLPAHYAYAAYDKTHRPLPTLRQSHEMAYENEGITSSTRRRSNKSSRSQLRRSRESKNEQLNVPIPAPTSSRSRSCVEC